MSKIFLSKSIAKNNQIIASDSEYIDRYRFSLFLDLYLDYIFDQNLTEKQYFRLRRPNACSHINAG